MTDFNPETATSDQLWTYYTSETAETEARMVFGSTDLEVLIPAAAVSLCQAAWRNTGLEKDHGSGRINDPEMMAANASTTRLIANWLWGDDGLGLWSEELVTEICAPERHLGGGLVVGDVVSDLDDLFGHAEGTLEVFVAIVAQLGFEAAMAGVAVAGSNKHWWGMPWWDLMVDDALALKPQLDGEAPPPLPPMRTERARRLLRIWPDECPVDLARWAIDDAAIGFRGPDARKKWRVAQGMPEAYSLKAFPMPPFPPSWGLAVFRDVEEKA